MNQNNLTSEERWLAALSHAAVLIPTLGLFAPLIVWVPDVRNRIFCVSSPFRR